MLSQPRLAGMPSDSPDRPLFRAVPFAAALLAIVGGGWAIVQSTSPDVGSVASMPQLVAPATTQTTVPASGDGLSSLWAQVEANQYHIASSADGKLLLADNPAQKLQTEFGSSGVSINSQVSDAQLVLRTLSVNGERLDATPVMVGQTRVERRGPGVSEWYVNDVRGLEQGWTIDEPSLDHPNRVNIRLQAGEGLEARPLDGGLSFHDASGAMAFTYSAPIAWDANQRPLAVSLEHHDRVIELSVDTRDATYPVTVDPLIKAVANVLNGTILANAVVNTDSNNIAFVAAQLSNVGGSKFIANETSGEDKFGQFVAIDGDLAVVGAVQRNDFQGAAYVFQRNSGGQYTQIATLVANDRARRDQFGYSVAIEGQTILIGAPGKSGNIGAVYVFTPTGTQIAKITVPNGALRDRFGFSVALSGDTVVVGAPYKNVGTVAAPLETNLRGTVYAFSRNQGGINAYGQIAEIIEPAGADKNVFGWAVAVSGNTAVISSDYFQARTGAAYVYSITPATGAVLLKTLLAPDGTPNSQFGRAVDIDQDTVVVGASGQPNGSKTRQGSVYLFARDRGGANNFGQVIQLRALNGATDDFFGRGVAVNQKLGSITLPVLGAQVQPLAFVMVGAPGLAPSRGKAYLYNVVLDASALGLTSAAQVPVAFEKVAADGQPNDQLGFSVGLSGEVAIAGAVGVNGGAGATYIFPSGLVPNLLCTITGIVNLSLGCT